MVRAREPGRAQVGVEIVGQERLGPDSVVVSVRYAHLTEGLGDELIQKIAPAPPRRVTGST